MGHKVLVADDSGTMRKIIRRALAASGVTESMEAGDGAAAWDLFRAGGVSLVLTDWNLPHKTGLELLKEIRQVDRITPVIMITTKADKSCVMTAIEAGCNDYLVKPFTADALRQKLSRYIG
ncbi:MAG: response regulator [Planctomycetes bacterium]|nr:response regulator [Planctomycetota bacterium]